MSYKTFNLCNFDCDFKECLYKAIHLSNELANKQTWLGKCVKTKDRIGYFVTYLRQEFHSLHYFEKLKEIHGRHHINYNTTIAEYLCNKICDTLIWCDIGNLFVNNNNLNCAFYYENQEWCMDAEKLDNICRELKTNNNLDSQFIVSITSLNKDMHFLINSVNKIKKINQESDSILKNLTQLTGDN